MSRETKDLNNYEYTSSYNHYNNINQNMFNLPYVSGPSTYNANLSSHEGAYDLGFELSPSSSEFLHPPFNQYNGLSNPYNSSHKSLEVVGDGSATIESEIRVSASPSSSEADHRPSEGSGMIPRKREADDGGEDPSQKIPVAAASESVQIFPTTTAAASESVQIFPTTTAAASESSPHIYPTTTAAASVSSATEFPTYPAATTRAAAASVSSATGFRTYPAATTTGATTSSAAAATRKQ